MSEPNKIRRQFALSRIAIKHGDEEKYLAEIAEEIAETVKQYSIDGTPGIIREIFDFAFQIIVDEKK